jgi:hypothetical protein
MAIANPYIYEAKEKGSKTAALGWTMVYGCIVLRIIKACINYYKWSVSHWPELKSNRARELYQQDCTSIYTLGRCPVSGIGRDNNEHTNDGLWISLLYMMESKSLYYTWWNLNLYIHNVLPPSYSWWNNPWHPYNFFSTSLSNGWVEVCHR